MDMGRRSIIPDEKPLLNEQCVDLWDLPGNEKKLFLG